MTNVLTSTEVRVLGALIEKDITTPDYYPLSLNALVNACNQKNNREPVMSLDEGAVRGALASLQEKRLAGPASGADSRVTKFEHRLQVAYNCDRRETAVLCVLLLRGPQTPGELRTRAERMYAFEDLDAVHSALNLLMRREPSLVKVLPRQPGTKESRFMHLFSGDVASALSGDPEPPVANETSAHDQAERVTHLEAQVADLRRELETLREQFAAFQKQFQ